MRERERERGNIWEAQHVVHSGSEGGKIFQRISLPWGQMEANTITVLGLEGREET